MDYRYGYQQRRSRSQPRMPQQPSPAYRSSELEYPVSATGGGGGSYFSTSGGGYVGGENRPWRSRSLENRRDWVVSDDYGFPATGTDDRYTSGTMRYQSQHHQQRNYDYQPYLSVSTGPTIGYRGTYDGRRGPSVADPYFDTTMPQYSTRSIPAESEWDALDRSIRNYREDPSAEHVAATMRRSKAQSLSPARPSGFFGGPSGGTKSRRHNFSSLFHRQSGTAGGTVGPQSGASVNRSESMLRYRNDYSSGPIDEVEFGAERGYYRSGGTNQQQQELYGPGPGIGSTAATGTMRGRTMTRGAAGGAVRYFPEPQKYYKLHCCCLSFRWPPWAVEEVDPPQPMYRHT